MNLVGTGLYAGAQYSARRVPELRAKVTGLDTELRQCVWGRPNDVAGAIEEVDEIGIVVNSVQDEVILCGTLPVRDKIASAASGCISERRSHSSRQLSDVHE